MTTLIALIAITYGWYLTGLVYGARHRNAWLEAENKELHKDNYALIEARILDEPVFQDFEDRIKKLNSIVNRLRTEKSKGYITLKAKGKRR